MIKLLVKKTRKCYKEQVNAGRLEVEYEMGQKNLLNVNNFAFTEPLTRKFMSRIWSSISHLGIIVQGHVQVGVTTRDQSASDIPCLITKVSAVNPHPYTS